MKKYTIVALAALLTVVFSLPVGAAIEHEFGGSWYTRMYSNRDFSGNDNESMDYTVVDTRTRLFYTATLNPNIKFVNKFEMDAVWGGPEDGYGNIGADGIKVEVKNTFLDVTHEPMNIRMGIQDGYLGRGFIFDDDFAGIIATMKSDTIEIPFIWVRAYEGNNIRTGRNKRDVDYFAIAPTFTVSEGFAVNPYIMYAMSDNAQDWDPLSQYKDVGIYYIGVNVDYETDLFGLWFTGIYQGGSADHAADTSKSDDFAAYLGAFGGNVKVSDTLGVHFQTFYASGQDPDDKDRTAFYVPAGQSYYWSEIMGYGEFDAQVSSGSPGDQISNIFAANIGASVSPVDKLSLNFDIWYAKLVEKDENNEDYLGTELNLGLGYSLLENIQVQAIAAYLFAGDATTAKASNDANPYELGVKFSIKF